MSILIHGMEMPKDCPMCPLAHWDFTGEFRGCKVVNGKKYAMETDPGYPETNFRPSWCPLVPVPSRVSEMARPRAANVESVQVAAVESRASCVGGNRMNTMKIKEILEKHKKWLADEEGGERANLSGADLSRANLSGANRPTQTGWRADNG